MNEEYDGIHIRGGVKWTGGGDVGGGGRTRVSTRVIHEQNEPEGNDKCDILMTARDA